MLTEPSRLNESTTMATNGSTKDMPRFECNDPRFMAASLRPDDAGQADGHHPLNTPPVLQR